MPLFGQDLFEKAEKTKGLDDPAYKKAARPGFAYAGPNGIDRLLKEHKLDALVGPTMPPAWQIDAVHGDQISGRRRRLSRGGRRLSAPDRADGPGEGAAGRA